jgi:hypothetical protein
MYAFFLRTFLLEQVFLLGAIAKLGATVVTYPLLVVKVHENSRTCGILMRDSIG